jgi:hypothetical protein
MTTFNKTVNEFFILVQQYKFLDAVDKFYDPNIISADNAGEPIKGIEKLRQSVKDFVASTEMNKIELLSSMVSDNLSVAHWHYMFTHNKFGKLDYKQISVQRWKDGKIIQENHFYNLNF